MVQKSAHPAGGEFSVQHNVSPELSDLLCKPLSELLLEVNSRDRLVSSLVLEAVVVKLMQLLQIGGILVRMCSHVTEHREIGIIFEVDHPIFSRWQVQCKDTESLTINDVAREVGLTYLLKSNVIVMISTGNIEDAARHYADEVMRKSNLCIVMLDGADLHAVATKPMHIKQVFSRETQRAKGLRPLDI